MSSRFTKKALRIINFSPCNSHPSPLFKKSFILKFLDKVNLESNLIVSKSINNFLPSLFNDWSLFSSNQHNYETSWSSYGNLPKPFYKTNIYGKNVIVVRAVNVLNNSQKLLKIYLLIQSKTFCQMRFLRSIEIDYQLSDILN